VVADVTTRVAAPRPSLNVMNRFLLESRGATALRTTTILIGAYFTLSLLTLAVAVLLRDDPTIVNIAVWIRGCFAAASGGVLLALAMRASRGSAAAYLRVRIIAPIIVVAITVIVLLPGTFPLWMKVEQAACGLLLLAVAVVVNLRRTRAVFSAR
jgi:hypothetical protein